uniref:Aminopeptidase n=1 Tax=Pyxicephalus adspersus TaxID=30357 RepID=A0AAV3AH64_PYXAD|nr:TPA: hypothetical protein GDO54_014303 [Pyxicephalus adspersus]
MEPASNDRAQLPRNMIENSMFEEEPDVVDLAKEPSLNPLESDEVEYEPRSSRLLVRGLGEHELDDDEEDYESSAKLLGMSFMNRSSGRNNPGNYRQVQEGLCPTPSARTVIVSVVVVVILVSIVTVVYLLPKCTFTKEGCHKKNHSMELVYPIATNGELFPWTKSRLPNSIMPLEYEISLHPNLTTMEFSGSVQIKMKIVEDTKTVVLHSSGLQNIEASVNLTGGATHKLSVLEYPTFDMIALVLPEKLAKGIEFTLNIDYCSNFSSSYYGFYKISYMDQVDSSTKWLAATQFEPLAARKAFPCFDEPAFKSTFQVKIKRTETHIALSNMPKIRTTQLPNGLFLDEFATSVKMSTYLVAFIVSEMNSSSISANGTTVSVYSIPQKVDQAQYALSAGAILLEFYTQYFGIAYPLSKLDLVAIPDIQAGAMENWGLITFRETTLLYKENSSSLMDKQLITTVIAHELAHQWFGNLVTMEWWNDLWLNEGFATFMEYFALQSKFPDLNADNNFLTLRCDAMEKDALQTSHPISTDVQSPEQIEEIFDDLSYIKGASILLMLKAHLSEETFHKCIMQYLKEHQYGSTKSDGLWDSMNQVTCTVWHVPLTYTYGLSNGTTSESVYLLRQKQDKFILQSEPSWLKFNVKMTGYYIVDYGQEGWNALIGLLQNNHTLLTASDRANLIHDIFVLSGVGRVQLTKAIELIAYLVNETDIGPIKQAYVQISHIHDLLAKQGYKSMALQLKKRFVDLLADLTEGQTWSDEGSLSEQELRSLLLELSCSIQQKNCIGNATELFNNWKNGSHLPTAVMTIVYKVGARTDEGWEHLLKMYTMSLYEAEKIKMLEALASTDHGKKLLWLMKAGLHGNVIRSQDFPIIIRFISENVPGFLLAWNFVKQNWDEITQKFPPGSFPIQTIVTKSTSQFATEVYLNEVVSFFNSTKGTSRNMWCVEEAIETIKLNIQWIDNNLNSLQNWL